MPVAEARVLPHNLDAERSVLGAMLVNDRAFVLAASILGSNDFYREAHKRIFLAVERLSVAGSAIDGLTLKNELERVGDLDEVGGPSYVHGLADGMPRSTNVEHYARIVVEKALLRATIEAANNILTSAYDETEIDATALVDYGVQRLLALSKPTAGGAKTIGAVMKEWLSEFEGDRQLGFPTGLTDLDDLLRGGLHPRELMMIAGRPGMGKSTLMMNVAESLAATGIATAVFTMEMAPTALVEGTIARMARVDAERLRAKILNQDDYARLSAAMETVYQFPLYLVERATSLSQVQAWCRRLSDHGVRVFCVDYIQRMGNLQARDRRLEIDYISRSFQRLALDLNASFVVLSQLTRASEHRTDKRPQMSDLKESGGLEADADTIILIYRDDAYKRNSEEAGVAELIVAKQRYGPTGVAKVAFLREQLRFANLDRGGE